MAVLSPEQIRIMEEQRKRQAAQTKIAESRASATPIIPQSAPLAPGQMGGGQSPLQQIGMKIGTKLLGGLFGGLFNKGGLVSADAMRDRKMHSNHLLPQYKASGGPLSKHPNPMGYNEGGAVGETPIKKVMDEQKLMQQQMKFEMDEMRAQEKHQLSMQQQRQSFNEAQKMKRESATTSMKPKKPLEK